MSGFTLTSDQEMELVTAAFAAAEAIWKHVAAAKAGTVSAAEALSSIKGTVASIPSQIAANDGAAEIALDAKFPADETTPTP